MIRFNTKTFPLFKILPLLILLSGLIAFFYFHLYEYLTFQSLKQYRYFLTQWTNEHFFLSSLIFIGLYIIAVAITLPNAVLLTLFGGFLFGPFWGTLYVVISATLGACIIFLAAKTALHDLLLQKAKSHMETLEKKFKKNAINYLLFLRLVPIFPFWLINIISALLAVPLKIFFLTTLIGIIPGTLVYTLLGNGLGIILDQGKTPDLDIIFHPHIIIPLIALAILALVPIIYKRIKDHGQKN